VEGDCKYLPKEYKWGKAHLNQGKSMDLKTGFMVLAGVGLFFVLLGWIALFSVPTKKSRKKSTDRILSKLVFEEIAKVKEELNNYFAHVLWYLMKANLYFYVAFMILVVAVTELNPEMSMFQVMVRLVPFALISSVISTVVKGQIKNFQLSCFDKLNNPESSS